MYVQLTSIVIANEHETIRPSGIFSAKKPGTMVAIRPCNPIYEDRTYLGMYLCDAPTGFIGRQEGDTRLLKAQELGTVTIQ